jgi:diaminohydroxyphosphoribosylaminopyrimidine deaminase/5-amino-6-(5-phosphoribosylamino)uracil reductase
VPLWVVTSEAADSAGQQTLAAQGVDVLRAATTGGKLNLGNVLTLLAQRGITRLMVESGPILAAALLRADFIDEVALFRSCSVIGPHGIEALDALPLSALTQSPSLKLVGSEIIEADTLEKYERA